MLPLVACIALPMGGRQRIECALCIVIFLQTQACVAAQRLRAAAARQLPTAPGPLAAQSSDPNADKTYVQRASKAMSASTADICSDSWLLKVLQARCLTESGSAGESFSRTASPTEQNVLVSIAEAQPMWKAFPAKSCKKRRGVLQEFCVAVRPEML